MRSGSLAAFTACALGLAACASAPTSYVHPPSGLALPERVGEFELSEVFPSAVDLGEGAETAHYEWKALRIARISITVRPLSKARGDASGELDFSTHRFARVEKIGPTERDAFALLGATRPAARAHLDLGKGSFPDHVEVIVVPWEGFVVEGRLYSRKQHDAALEQGFRAIVGEIGRASPPVSPARP